MNRSSFSEAINQLISEITDAQSEIKVNGTKMLKKVFYSHNFLISFLNYDFLRPP